ncbi:MAG TPA: HdeD family acid-resistance protein [Bacteroidia bacterium]|nr:MAG: membrane protein [Bacteroidetes bacterium OLB10]MBV6454939.1 hypothetical protein [Bacteroidia bacterium]MBX3106755.1 HdeD family acid-resistance protein [Bacteroidota bacterium]MCB8929482.1 HdeD family acid-resistance protein [Bacteroidia bacterium]MCO5288925.1 HdeD family acid-resistance protein [Bacteroidota bacterium]
MKSKFENRLNYWYLLLITGIMFIILSIGVFFTPLSSFLALAWVISFGFVIGGISEIAYSVSNRKKLKNWGWYLAGGIITLILGLQLSLIPGVTGLILCYYIGFWLLFRSIMEITNSIDLKKYHVKYWGWVLTFGILGVITSLILLWNPIITSVAIIYCIGIGLLMFGVVQIVLAFGLRKIKDKIENIREDFEQSDFESSMN